MFHIASYLNKLEANGSHMDTIVFTSKDFDFMNTFEGCLQCITKFYIETLKTF